MKILLLGKDGQVGHTIRPLLPVLGEVIGIGRQEQDLTDLTGLNHLLNYHQPHIIINAAAYTAVDKAESERDVAFAVNEKAVEVLAKYARSVNALFVNYSTDYVFDGEKTGPYVETDTVNPKNAYGASKVAGEQATLESGCAFLTFRTSWVYSPHGHNFIKTILKLAREKDKLSIVSDQRGVPSSAAFIAQTTVDAIVAHQAQRLESGIYHLTPAGETNWHQLAVYIVEQSLLQGENLRLNPDQIKPIATEQYPVPAKRPKNSLLDSNLLFAALGVNRQAWSYYVDRMIRSN